MWAAAGGTRSVPSMAITPTRRTQVDGTLAILDPDHATFTSKGGLTVQLVRRDGREVPAVLHVTARTPPARR